MASKTKGIDRSKCVEKDLTNKQSGWVRMRVEGPFDLFKLKIRKLKKTLGAPAACERVLMRFFDDVVTRRPPFFSFSQRAVPVGGFVCLFCFLNAAPDGLLGVQNNVQIPATKKEFRKCGRRRGALTARRARARLRARLRGFSPSKIKPCRRVCDVC